MLRYPVQLCIVIFHTSVFFYDSCVFPPPPPPPLSLSLCLCARVRSRAPVSVCVCVCVCVCVRVTYLLRQIDSLGKCTSCHVQTDRDHDMYVLATSGDAVCNCVQGNPSFATVHVTVRDVNDNPPNFTQSHLTFGVASTADAGHVIANLQVNSSLTPVPQRRQARHLGQGS